MKLCYSLSILFFFLLSSLQAAPGDTTVVQSHTITQLANFGNYDAPVVFPNNSTTYRDITMTFTLGKYQCPGNPQYCGSWDYTVQIYLITPTDTLEIGRLITPYATTSAQYPYTWQHRYNFDVTDYAQYLKGNNTIRIHYSGYSGGFTANVKFTCIEGTPPRNVVKIARLWNGSFGYGNPTSVEAKMNARTLQMPATATGATLKFNVTGHGGNANDNCSEFCSKYYQVKVNNALTAQTNIWRNNCGSNNLYPQTGTWVYDRANWCPGDVVYSNFHPITGITPGSNFALDVDFQPYTNTSSQASYSVEGHVIYYGAYNYPVDAALESIISPNNYEGYFRSNPTCEDAKITVKNTGSTAITSLELSYGLQGGTMHTLPVTVAIQPGNSEEIILSGNTEFVTMGNGSAKFVARITKTNGAADPNTLNNEMITEFTPMTVWPNDFVVKLSTNAAGSQTKWRIFDAAGNVVKDRLTTTSSTTYNDTLQLPAGCYRLEVTDSGCNGLYWWAAQSQGRGSIAVQPMASGNNIQLKGYFGGDFGCGFTEAFRIQNALGMQEEKAAFNLSVYPNPAQTTLNVNMNENQALKGATLELLNTLGQQVYFMQPQGHHTQVPVHNLPAGIYILRCQAGNKFVQKQIVITR